MKKVILSVAECVALMAMVSCQKSNSNQTYSCICNFILITGPDSRDTSETVTYPSGTTLTDARTNCNNQQDTLVSTGKTSAACLLSD